MKNTPCRINDGYSRQSGLSRLEVILLIILMLLTGKVIASGLMVLGSETEERVITQQVSTIKEELSVVLSSYVLLHDGQLPVDGKALLAYANSQFGPDLCPTVADTPRHFSVVCTGGTGAAGKRITIASMVLGSGWEMTEHTETFDFGPMVAQLQ